MTLSASKKSDISLLNKTLFRLALPRLILRTLAVLIVAAAWYVCALWLLDFGKTVDYAFLAPYSPQVAEYLHSINKYIWWGLILVISIILYFIVSSLIASSIEKAGYIVPKPEVTEKLIPQLSAETKEVLVWVWGDQREPITIKNLHDTRAQLRHDRIQRLQLIHRQRELLGVPEPLPPFVEAEVDAPSLSSEYEKVEHVLQDINLNLNDDVPTLAPEHQEPQLADTATEEKDKPST